MSPSSQSSKSALASETLLYSREAARQLLGGIIIASVKRLERYGELTPVRLNKRSPTAQVFYRRAQVLALAQGGDDVSE